MDINSIKDENNSKDPIGLEVALEILTALLSTIQIIQFHEHNKNLKNKNQLDKINKEISILQNLSKEIMEFLATYSSQNNFNLDAKVTIKDTRLFLKQNDLIKWMQLYQSLKAVEVEISKLKIDLSYYAIRNKLNLDIDVNDHLVTNFDSLLSNMDEMSFFGFMTGLTDSISEISKRLADLNSPKLR